MFCRASGGIAICRHLLHGYSIVMTHVSGRGRASVPSHTNMTGESSCSSLMHSTCIRKVNNMRPWRICFLTVAGFHKVLHMSDAVSPKVWSKLTLVHTRQIMSKNPPALMSLIRFMYAVDAPRLLLFSSLPKLRKADRIPGSLPSSVYVSELV